MRHYVAKICLLLTLSRFSLTEWVEIAKSQAQESREEEFTTPSSVWIEYQRERFGYGKPNNPSNPLVVTDAGGLKNSAHIVVPINSQIINARTKFVVKNTSPPPVEIDVDVLVTPNVETTSRRHSSLVESASDADSSADTATEQNVENVDDDSLGLPSMKGFLKFLKSMQKTWIKKSTLGIEKKIKLLKQLSENLMKVIEQQFAVLWQPTERHRRRRRGLLDDSSLDFPPEAALMSINFLTFAVFLIKLVLQVVQIVKSKHYNLSGFNINADIIRSP